VADRYCSNCGHELRDEDRFCPSCGKPARETAHVPTPEADVPVPPTPVEQTGAPTASGGQWNKAFLGCFGVLALLALLGVLGGALVGGGGGNQSRGDANRSSTPEPEGAQGAQEDQYSTEVGTFTRENYGVLVANPEEHTGAEVDIYGQLLDSPEKQGSEVAFQMWADPVKAEWNTLVRTDEEALGLGTDTYVHVRGTVLGSFEGENAFGGSVSAVEVEADKIERVEAVDAVDPTQKTVKVGQTRSNEGFSMTLVKLEFGMRHTRAYVTARNDGIKNASLDLYRSKIIQGSDRAGQTDPFDYSVPKPREGLQPGAVTEGVVVFRRADPSQPLQVSFAWESGGFMDPRPEPLVFQVTP
jgi:hypothetical protein